MAGVEAIYTSLGDKSRWRRAGAWSDTRATTRRQESAREASGRCQAASELQQRVATTLAAQRPVRGRWGGPDAAGRFAESADGGRPKQKADAGGGQALRCTPRDLLRGERRSGEPMQGQPMQGRPMQGQPMGTASASGEKKIRWGPKGASAERADPGSVRWRWRTGSGEGRARPTHARPQREGADGGSASLERCRASSVWFDPRSQHRVQQLPPQVQTVGAPRHEGLNRRPQGRLRRYGDRSVEPWRRCNRWRRHVPLRRTDGAIKAGSWQRGRDRRAAGASFRRKTCLPCGGVWAVDGVSAGVSPPLIGDRRGSRFFRGRVGSLRFPRRLQARRFGARNGRGWRL